MAGVRLAVRFTGQYPDRCVSLAAEMHAHGLSCQDDCQDDCHACTNCETSRCCCMSESRFFQGRTCLASSLINPQINLFSFKPTVSSRRAYLFIRVEGTNMHIPLPRDRDPCILESSKSCSPRVLSYEVGVGVHDGPNVARCDSCCAMQSVDFNGGTCMIRRGEMASSRADDTDWLTNRCPDHDCRQLDCCG
jgi:hypothetical protein